MPASPNATETISPIPDTDTFGIGKVEDLSWKGMLDLGACTECGRCQSQCPAWATGKPLSPKQLILDLRDHAFAKAPYLLATEEERVTLSAEVLAEAERATRAIAELLHAAGVKFAVLGPAESTSPSSWSAPSSSAKPKIKFSSSPNESVLRPFGRNQSQHAGKAKHDSVRDDLYLSFDGGARRHRPTAATVAGPSWRTRPGCCARGHPASSTGCSRPRTTRMPCCPRCRARLTRP